MRSLLLWTARCCGTLGVALIALAIATRAGGDYWLFGVQVGTLLQGGMATTLVACLAYVASIAESRTGG